MRVASSVPVSKSHSFRVLSNDAETARFPSGAIATAFTQLLCPVRVASSVPVSKSHSFRVLSLDAETARFPSGVMATAYTESLCPVRDDQFLPCPQNPQIQGYNIQSLNRSIPNRRDR
ncbi:hypothetical protein SPLC1_S190040 [Arthrospira platensis C1]|nr:hypothetical protein SPLC1_S190040 [Arthrospira platensis C1]